MKRARWWRPLDDGRIECFLCPRHCRLQDGQRAFCFVRERRGDALYLSTYGRSTGFCVDPVEKKPLNHFLPGSAVLSFGTAGCNLGCKFCQNWSISKSREIESLSDPAPPAAIAAAAREHGCAAVAFTYNDPVIWAEYAIDTARACRAAGVRTIAVTAGFVEPAAREELFAWMDAANVDLKAFSDPFYRELALAGRGGLRHVLDTLVWLRHESRTWFEITTLLIPGANDSDEELGAMTAWIAGALGPDVPLHFTAFHPDFRLMDRGPTPASTLLRARDIAHEAGLRYVYAGNVLHREAQSTWCAGCGALLIEREGYELGGWGLDGKGCCAACGTRLPGVFLPRPGDWGSRRQPIRIDA